ncbi:SRP40, C-terminal domain-containing protein [Flagelloscypha sp. PMI_526]|nr:SRP40, C-terminal domain-containing protein [Flagelloscypha sp. PMI_526]
MRTGTSSDGIPIATTTATVSTKFGGQGSSKATPVTAQRFSRLSAHSKMVDLSGVAEQDNRYESKAGPQNDYGAKAHADLIVTRGAGFRKEKNKKKRGSYRGGEITMSSHSIKFD